MSAISNYLENALLNAVFRGQPYTSPSNVYLALYTSDPTDADTGVEVSGGSYARVVVNFSAPIQEDGKGVIRNVSDIQLPVATADWGTITHVGVRDALTGGNLLYHGALQNTRTILTGDRLTFLEGELVLKLS